MTTIETIHRNYLLFSIHDEDGELIEKKKVEGDFNEIVDRHGGSSNASWRQVGNEHWMGQDVQAIHFPTPAKGSIPPRLNREKYVRELIEKFSPFAI